VLDEREETTEKCFTTRNYREEEEETERLTAV
jgi:hypothetical protein